MKGIEGGSIREAEYIGGIYQGEWVSGMPHGQGTFTWPSDRVYKGGCVGDERHGNCLLYTSPSPRD